MRRQLAPQPDALALVVVVEAGTSGAAATVELEHHLVDHRVPRLHLVGAALGLHSSLRLLADTPPENQAHLVGQGQRRRRVAGLQPGLLDRRGRAPLVQHRNHLVDKGSDDPRREESSAVVDHDRKLLDLQGDVDGSGQRGVGRLLADDDLQQLHLVDRREEVHADEVLGTGHALGKTRHRKSRGVRGEERVIGQQRLDLGVDVLLQRHVLEDGLDHEVGALGVRERVGRKNAVEDLRGLLLAHPAARDLLGEQLLTVRLALLRSLDGHVLEHDLQAVARADVGDAGAHHPGPQHCHLAGLAMRVLGRTASALRHVLEVEEERLDHVGADGPGGKVHEVLGLDAQRVGEVHL